MLVLLPCWNDSMWVLQSCIKSLFMVVQQWHNLILDYFGELALVFCKVRIKLSGRHSKARRICFLFSSHFIASYIHSEATMMNIAIHSQQETLICTFNQQVFLALAQVVLSFLLFLLIFTFWCVSSSECRQVMFCIGVRYSLITVFCYFSWPIQ